MKRRYLIAYDISSPRRLSRVHRQLKKVAVPIQYSVFIGAFSHSNLTSLIITLKNIIDSRDDDIRIYSLPENIKEERMGVADPLPADALLIQSTDSHSWRI